MECNFQVGDEVVCVDADGARELSQGAVYIIERVVRQGDIILCHDGIAGVAEAPGFSVWVFGGADFRDPYEDYAGYRPARFRKVQRPTTTIEQFTRVPVGDTSRWDKSRRVPAKTPEKADV